MPKDRLANLGQLGSKQKIDGSKQKAVYYVVFMVLLLSLVIASTWASIQPRNPEGRYNSEPHEKLAIGSVSVGASINSLSIIVAGVSGSEGQNAITIQAAFIRNATGAVVQITELENNPAIIPIDGSQITVQVDLTSPLLSGERYTVNLITQAGGNFASPVFTVP